MSLYLSCLPSDLITPLFLHLSSEELIHTLTELNNTSFSPDKWSKSVWKIIWKRNISSVIDLPQTPCQKYIDIIKTWSRMQWDYRMIEYSATGGYDILLTPYMNVHYFPNVLDYASEKGHRAIIDKVMEKQGQLTNHNVGTIIISAASGGQFDLVKDMLNLCIERNYCDHYNYNCAMRQAAVNGHIEIVKLFIDTFKNHYTKYEWKATYSETLANALVNGHTNIAWLMLNEDVYVDSHILKITVQKCYVDILSRLLNETNDNINYYELIIEAAKHQRKDIIQILLNKANEQL